MRTIYVVSSCNGHDSFDSAFDTLEAAKDKALADYLHYTPSERSENEMSISSFELPESYTGTAQQAYDSALECDDESIANPATFRTFPSGSEAIEIFRSELADKLKELNRDVLECDGRIMERVYIWSDGQIETMQEAQGSSMRLRAKQWETRKLYHVATIEYPFFDWTQFTSESVPDKDEDPDAYEDMRSEVIDFFADDYDPDPVLDQAIEDYKQEEEN